MPEDTLIVGLVLLSVTPFVVWDAVGTLRNGFDGAFWARSLDDKMGHISQHGAAWERIGIVWVPIELLLAAGVTAFAVQLMSAGEVVWAALGLGSFMLSAAIFLPAALLMVTTVSQASEARLTDGATPPWVQPAWRSTWWLERAFIIGANLAYVSWGVGIVSSGFPAAWAGWVAIVSGTSVAIWASLREYFFQHMVLLVPIVLGVALVLA